MQTDLQQGGRRVEEFTNSKQVYRQIEVLDEHCALEGVRAELLVIGGAGLILLLEQFGREFRPTTDVDVQVLGATNMNDVQKALNKSDIHIVGGVSDLPPIEDFLLKGKKFRLNNLNLANITVYVPTPEMLACTKIFSTRPKDLYDLERSEVLDVCDLNVLRNLIDDYKLYMQNPNDMNMNVHQIERIISDRSSKGM